MIPTIDRIRTHRARTLWGIRLLAAASIALGLYLTARFTLFAMMTGQLTTGWQVFSGVGVWHHPSHGLAMIAIGLALALLSRRIARWIVAIPDRGCPACRYTGERDAAGRCPECGLELPAR